MARWKVITYLTDECQEHDTPEECETPPKDWNEEEDGEYEPGDWCYFPAEPGSLDTREEAQRVMNFFFTYGDKHQSGGFTGTTIEPVN